MEICQRKKRRALRAVHPGSPQNRDYLHGNSRIAAFMKDNVRDRD
ncbi:MAG: hypothetical protein AB4290_00645 [Spirulina sp.]